MCHIAYLFTIGALSYEPATKRTKNKSDLLLRSWLAKHWRNMLPFGNTALVTQNAGTRPMLWRVPPEARYMAPCGENPPC